MAKEVKSAYVLTFPLKTTAYEEKVLDERMAMCHRLYNQCVKKSKAVYKNMARTIEFRSIKQELSDIQKEKDDESKKKRTAREKELFKRLNELYKINGLTEYGLQDMARLQAKEAGYKKNIDSVTAVKLGKRLWTAWNKFLFGNGQEVHFARYNDFNSMEGSYNTTGIKVRQMENDNWYVVWNGLKILIDVKENMYETEAFQTGEIAYNRIVRKMHKKKACYYVQTIFRGTPPTRRSKQTGESICRIGKGRVGLYITLTTITAVSDEGVFTFPLADTENIDKEIAELNQKMDRSRRATNPDNYNEDGTIKKQGNKKVTWVRSNRYEELRKQLRSLQTKQAQVRKYQQECLANKILSLGDDFIINKRDYKAAQERSKEETQVKEDGTCKSKKRFGTAIANYSPSQFVSILNRKLGYYERSLFEADAKALTIQNLNHITGEEEERSYAAKMVEIAGIKVDKHAYFAFLLSNLTPDYKDVDLNRCEERFQAFVQLIKEPAETAC